MKLRTAPKQASIKVDITQFDYQVPESLIAQHPCTDRSSCKLLVLGDDVGSFVTRIFTDLVEILRPGDLLVVNNTRVLPARLYGNKPTGGKVEVMLERIIDDQHALVLLGSNKPVNIGLKIRVKDCEFEVTDRRGTFFVIKTSAGYSAQWVFESYGVLPLPPYIQRNVNSSDQQQYQTVYSKIPGAVAAPTAGLHFDHQLMDQLLNLGVALETITLHVGAGTFQPVKVNDINQHVMHSERVCISDHCCQQINKTRQAGGRVVAVGTTVVRALEAAGLTGELKPMQGDTDLFITPGFQFNVVDALITNFHLPKSTLLMMVCAFAGYERTLAAYQFAVTNRFRFFSYGDAMFVEGAS